MSVAVFHPSMRAAIRERLLTVSGLPAQHWEGRPFTPVRGTPWVSESYRPLSSDVRGLGIGGTIAHSVNASFTLHYPAGPGTAQIEAMAGAILQVFRPGTSLTYNGTAGVVQQAQMASVVQEPDWINLAVTVTLIGYTVN
jgi:hypothetical protein